MVVSYRESFEKAFIFSASRIKVRPSVTVSASCLVLPPRKAQAAQVIYNSHIKHSENQTKR